MRILHGKIDAKSLPEATIYRSGSTSKAANKIEEDFCKIFGKILQIEDVGADESFFDLGGTSLLVTRVVIMAQKVGYKVNFAVIVLLANLPHCKKMIKLPSSTKKFPITITQNLNRFSTRITWKISEKVNVNRLAISY